MNPEEYHRALRNRFRVIHGAETEVEVEACAGMVPLIGALLTVVEEEFQRRAVIGLVEYVEGILTAAAAPAPRRKVLLSATLREAEATTKAVMVEVTSRSPQ